MEQLDQYGFPLIPKKGKLLIRAVTSGVLGFLVFPILAILKYFSIRAVISDPFLEVVKKTVVWIFFTTSLGFGFALILIGFGYRIIFSTQWVKILKVFLQFVIIAPSLAVCSGWIAFLGEGGLVRRWFGISILYSWGAVTLAWSFAVLAWYLIQFLESFESIELRPIEIARTFGFSHFTFFWIFIWPNLKRRWFFATKQGISWLLVAYPAVRLLGGGPPVETIETKLVEEATGGQAPLFVTFMWAQIILGILIGMWSPKWRVKNRTQTWYSSDSLSKKEKFVLVSSWLGITFFVLLPLLNSVPSSWSLTSWSDLDRSRAANALVTSLKIGVVVTGIAQIVGAVILGFTLTLDKKNHRDRFERGIASVGGVSGLVFLLGYYRLSAAYWDPFSHQFPIWIYFLIQGILGAFFISVASFPALQNEPGLKANILKSLGLSFFDTFRFGIWPKIFRSWMMASMAVFVWSLGEFSVSSFIFQQAGFETLASLSGHWLEQYRFEQSKMLIFMLWMLSGGLILFGRALVRRAR